jgi:protein-disulfide isomerase
VKINLEKTANVTMILSSIAMVAMVAYLTFRPKSSRSVSPDRDLSLESVNLTLALENLSSIGLKEATIGLLEFSDFECPFCGEFARAQFPRIKAEFVDVGSLRFYWANFPVSGHENAPRAAEAAVCADEQKRHLELFERLFRLPMKLEPVDLAEHAQLAGLEMQLFTSCMERGRLDVVKDHIKLGTQAGVRGTPTFIIGTISKDGSLTASQRITGLPTYEGLSNLLKHEGSRSRQ